MSFATLTASDIPTSRLAERYQKAVTFFVAIFVFCGAISLIEPSPYDLAALIALPLWMMGGFRVNKFITAVAVAWTIRELAAFAALTPYWNEPDPRLFQFQSLYLYVTVIFFTIFFAERTQERVDAALRAYAASTVLSAVVAVLSYLNLFGLDALTTIEGRVAGTFKDPNVFGSYLTLGAVIFLQSLLVGRARYPLLSAVSLGLVLTGVFLSFSRGSWGATVFALLLTAGMAFATHRDPRMRRRIILTGFAGLLILALVLLIVLSQDSIREFFFQRAKLEQEYDGGVTGRFGNQLRSLPMLLDRPMGFGPLRFRLVFDLEPHNSYIGAFANGGWLGGFSWIAIVLASVFVGFRLMFKPSPYRDHAQMVFPALLALLLQGFQIDIDHWRQLFLMCGFVWGLEAARRRWISQTFR